MGHLQHSTADTFVSGEVPKLEVATMSAFGELTQVSVITPDLEQTIIKLRAALGAGSFKVVTMDAPALFNRTYGGQPESWSMRLGISWIGNMQLEVIQPLGGKTVFRDYLEAKNGRPGIQHIFLDRTVSYEQALEQLSKAGYPLKQHGQMNAAGRLGILPMPALPGFLAARYGARFGYTSTQSSLKVDIEVAKFPPGVSQRLALRAAIAERWIPDEDRKHFERPTSEAILRDIDAVYVFARDVDALADAYGRLAAGPVKVEHYDGDLLPGAGRAAAIRAGSRTIFLVAPADEALRKLLSSEGEGIRILRGRPLATLAASVQALESRGWKLRRSVAGVLARHDEVPFALWLQSLE
jgi:hypothetical protein